MTGQSVNAGERIGIAGSAPSPAAIGRTLAVELPARVDAMVAAGALGRKTGRGFHVW